MTNTPVSFCSWAFGFIQAQCHEKMMRVWKEKTKSDMFHIQGSSITLKCNQGKNIKNRWLIVFIKKRWLIVFIKKHWLMVFVFAFFFIKKKKKKQEKHWLICRYHHVCNNHRMLPWRLAKGSGKNGHDFEKEIIQIEKITEIPNTWF